MAILSKLLVATTLLSTITLAGPLAHRKHIIGTQHADHAAIGECIAPSPPSPQGPPAAQSSIAEAETVMASSAVSNAPYGHPYSVSSMAPVAAVTTTAPVIQVTTTTTTTTPIIQVTSTTSVTQAMSVPQALAPTSTTTSPVPPPVSTSAPSSVASAGPAQGMTTGSPTGSITATCEGEGNACVGDVTYWEGGLGACGTVVNTDTDMAIALPYQFMGTESNDNPYCGRSVTLYNPNTGTTVQATVRDKCMGCVDRAIDCTTVLFNAITDNMGNGRYGGIVWWLN